MKYFMVAATFLVASQSYADPRFYAEYKNDLVFNDSHYVDNTARNMVRVGIQGEIFYAEVGPTLINENVGSSYEFGYKYNFNDSWLIKGKLEGFQLDTFEGDVGSKFETEVRYWFN